VERAIHLVRQLKLLPAQAPEYPVMRGETATEWISPYVIDIIDKLSPHNTTEGEGLLVWWSLWHLVECLISQKLQIRRYSGGAKEVSFKTFLFSFRFAFLFRSYWLIFSHWCSSRLS
jgi:hypothetical protein